MLYTAKQIEMIQKRSSDEFVVGKPQPIPSRLGYSIRAVTKLGILNNVINA